MSPAVLHGMARLLLYARLFVYCKPPGMAPWKGNMVRSRSALRESEFPCRPNKALRVLYAPASTATGRQWCSANYVSMCSTMLASGARMAVLLLSSVACGQRRTYHRQRSLRPSPRKLGPATPRWPRQVHRPPVRLGVRHSQWLRIWMVLAAK